MPFIVRVTGSINFSICLFLYKIAFCLYLEGGGGEGLGGGTFLIFRGGGGGGGGGVLGFGAVIIFYLRSPIIVIGINKTKSINRNVLVKK